MSELKIGFGRINLDAPTGIHISGYYSNRRAQGALDDLTASVLAVSDLRTTAINYADFYPEYYDEEYNIISEFDGESCLTSAIIYVSTEQLPVLYTTTGHGEYALPDTLITSLAQECFSVAELDLLTVDAVPEDASALVIHGPQTDFTEDETAIITEYLAAGGRLMVMTDVVTQRLANLEVLMGTYGVYAEQGIIVEGDSDHHLSSYQHYLFPDMAASEITDPISEAGYRVMVPLVHPLYVKADLRDGLRVIPLLTSSDSAYLKADAYNASTMEYVDGDKQGCFTLALQIEEDDMRILWFGTSMITDEVADSLVSGTNTDLLLNSFNWLSEQDSGLTIRPRSLNSGYLTLSSLEANTWQTVTAIVLPVVILTVGLTVWAIRRRR